MEKSAISLAIEEFNFVCDPSRNSEHTIGVIKWCIQQLENRYLELEKKQVIEAYDDALGSCESLDGLEYYTNKFNK